MQVQQGLRLSYFIYVLSCLFSKQNNTKKIKIHHKANHLF